MHPGLQEFLTQTVTHAAATGHDGYGDPTYAPAVPRLAYIEYTVRRMLNAYGEEIISRAQVFLETTPPVAIQDRLILPDGTSQKLQLVSSVHDSDGLLHHYKVYL